MSNRGIQIGDIIYYVTSQNESYLIRKSCVVNKTIEKHNIFRFFFDTCYYHCEDGYRFDTLYLCQPIFESISDAVEYVVTQLQRDIKGAEVSLRNAQEHLNRLCRSLCVYQKQLCAINSGRNE